MRNSFVSAPVTKEKMIYSRNWTKYFKKSRTEDAVVAASEGQNSLHSLHSLLVTNARVTLEDDLRDSIKQSYKQDSRWAEVLEQLESAQGCVTRIGNCEY